MSGKTDLYFTLARAAVIGLSVAAAATDLARGKIYNWLTFPAMVLGMGAAAVFGGWPALGTAALGIGIALVAYGALFALGAIAAGDVKLLMALGAWGGWRLTLNAGALAILFGGALAALILLFRGRLGDFSRRLGRSFLTAFVKELEFQPPQLDRKSKMPFGVPIAAAAICAELGVRLWN